MLGTPPGGSPIPRTPWMPSSQLGRRCTLQSTTNTAKSITRRMSACEYRGCITCLRHDIISSDGLVHVPGIGRHVDLVVMMHMT